MTPSVQSKAPEMAYIPCPRCNGQGRGTWHPDAGICYRCGGKAEVRINVQRHLNTLGMLRSKYRRLQAELQAAVANGDYRAAEILEESLRYTVQDGLRVRADLEEAGVQVH